MECLSHPVKLASKRKDMDVASGQACPADLPIGCAYASPAIRDVEDDIKPPDWRAVLKLAKNVPECEACRLWAERVRESTP